MSTEPTTDKPESGDEFEPHVVSPAQRARLQKLFEHGVKLTKQEKYDHDYANESFTQCVVHDPGNLVYVEAFLDNLHRKYNNNKKGATFKGFGKPEFKKAVSKKDWAGVLRYGPEQLKTNPWDIPTLRAMAEACAAYRYNEVELRYLKNALDGNPRDVEVNRHCARTLGRVGQFDQAIAVWHRIEELKKGDKEAAETITELSLERARARAGIPREDKGGPKTGARPPARPKPAPGAADGDRPAAKTDATAAAESPAEAPAAAEPAAAEPVSVRERLEQAIAKDPTDLQSYIQLAAHFTEEGELFAAEEVLERALEASGGNLKIRERLEDAQVRRAKQQAKIAEGRAKRDTSDEAQQLAQSKRDELLRLELSLFSARVERYPQNLALKYELGLRLKATGSFAPAIKYFLNAAEDPKLRAAGHLESGECFQHLKQYQRALDNYVAAIDAAGDDARSLQRALYRGGVLATGLKMYEQAEAWLARLIELEPNYKDAADRLDKARQLRNN